MIDRHLDEQVDAARRSGRLLVAGAVGPDALHLEIEGTKGVWPTVETDHRPGRRAVTLLASGRVPRLVGDSGWYWNPLDHSSEVTTMLDACDRALAAGCANSDAGWEIFVDGLGAQPMFCSVVDTTLWFSNSARVMIDVVRKVVGVDLAADGPDPVGWQSIMLVGFPPPGLSAFRRIRTLLPGSSVQLVPDGKVLTRRRAPNISPGGRRTTDDLLEALRSSLPEPLPPVDLPLSGGWDSRLLGGLLAEREDRRVTAWTTATDDGVELDLALAPDVARHLGMTHRVFVDREASWPELGRAIVRRCDYQTWLHGWLVPLAEHLRRHGAGTVVDGFGGDFVLRRLFQTPERDLAPGPDARRAIWTEMGWGRSNSEVAWSDEARALFSSGAAFEVFDHSVADLDGHPNWQALTVIRTRATRCIGVAPFRLLEPETRVIAPFLASSVRDVLFSEGIYDRRGLELYRSILDRLDPALASLPSTNDTDLVRERTALRRETSSASLLEIAEQISSNADALRLLAPRLRGAVEEADLDVLGRLTKYVVPLRALQAVFALSQWHLDHPGAQAGIWDD